MEHKWSELRLWNGGECPVGPDDRVWVLLEDMESRDCFARDYSWLHEYGLSNIIAYRVEVKPAPLIERWVNVFTDSCGKERVASLLCDTESAARIVAGPGARQILLREVRE